MNNAIMYDPCIHCVDKNCSICKITYQRNHIIGEHGYCKYCFNARVDEKIFHGSLDPYDECLTDDNDFSSHCIGVSCKPDKYNMMFNSGNGVPVNIECRVHVDNYGWLQVSKYYPKYCPECGRRLDEYEKELDQDD